MNWYENKPLSLTTPPDQMPIIGIGLEEHVIFNDLVDKLPLEAQQIIRRDKKNKYLKEIGNFRLAVMDTSGTYIQVLSWVAPGADKLRGDKAILFAIEVNNRIAKSINESPNPNRFRGYAHLPTSEPKEAAQELKRCILELKFVGAMIAGIYDDKFLDDPMFSPILSMAEELDCPIYIHPTAPPKNVAEAYYYTTKYLNKDQAFILSEPGWGWHSQIGLHVLRMCYAATFERHPKLKIIVGHNGEMLPMMVHREDTQDTGLSKPISYYLRKHIYVTLSGIFSLVPLKACIEAFGIERICWSTDYPYVPEAIKYGKNYIKSMRDIMTNSNINAIMFENTQQIMKI